MLYEVITELDLRNAIISGTVTVEARVVLGGIEIWVPNYVRVITKGDPILGSVENSTRTPAGANETTPTIIINSRITSYNVCYTKLLRCTKRTGIKG